MSLRAILNDPEPAPLSAPASAPIRNTESTFVQESYPHHQHSRSPSAARDDRPSAEAAMSYGGGGGGKHDRNGYEQERVRHASSHHQDYDAAPRASYPSQLSSENHGHSGSPSMHRASAHSHPRGPPMDDQPPPHSAPHRRSDRDRELERAYEAEYDAYAARAPNGGAAYPLGAAEWTNGSARSEFDALGRMHRPHATSPEFKEGVPEEYHSRSNVKKRSYYAERPPNEYGREEPPRDAYHTRPDSPPVSPLVEGEYGDDDRYMQTTDLSDNEEVWAQELSHYVLDTAKRQRAVERYFEENCVARNNEVAHVMSDKYASRLSRIPMNEPLHGARHTYGREHYGGRSPSPGPYQDFWDAERHRGAHRGHRTERHAAENEAAARAFEDEFLDEGPSAMKRGGYDGRKRGVAMTVSDASGDEREMMLGPLKKRRLDDGTADLLDDLEGQSMAGDDIQSVSTRAPYGSKGKGKAIGTPGGTSDVSSTKIRKKPGPKKKEPFPYLQQDADLSSAAISITGDVTPTPSRPPSPALSDNLIYEIGEPVPSMKRAKKVDEQVMAKRIAGLEESQRKVWLYIARRDVGKVYKHHLTGYQTRQLQTKRTATLCATQAKKIAQRTTRTAKEVQTKAKRLMREMMVFWKKNEKEERELRKRAEKEADSRAKEEEEKREATRQARKLEFLISQTELYSHFVGNKLKTAEIEGGENQEQQQEVPKGADGEDVTGDLADIDFDNEDTTNLHAHARRNAQHAIALAKSKAEEFDSQVALERKTAELAKAQAHIRDEEELVDTGENAASALDLDSDELNFQNPTSLIGPLTIHQPKMLQAQLKEYQLKGLNWLGTLYEQGINGILADEMGLGKTIQSISLLAHLAEAHNIWGPFLVVVPSSTLHNWQQELARFVPDLITLPYWGSPKDRQRLRNDWRKRSTGFNRDSPFHVLVTSYSLVIQDQQYLQRIKWQYMILDEAQNIKNSSSARWKTLLSLHSRNRLLLTGTPIQNNMQELWALLHFIMPSLFDSHDEFNEWFSKDIENAASDGKGGKLSEHQLRRLHMILKPFMLRRVKRHVQNELSEKIEIDIYVNLSARQKALYRAIRANVSVADIIEKATHIGDAEAARTLMNLLMQFRKVCNHPELFDRADVVAPYSFSEYGRPFSIAREGDFVSCHYSIRSPMDVAIPELFYLDNLLPGLPNDEEVPTKPEESITNKLMNIWRSDWIRRSIEEDACSPFNFVPMLGMTPGEASKVYSSSTVDRMVWSTAIGQRYLEEDPIALDSFFDIHESVSNYRIPKTSLKHLERAGGLPALEDIGMDAWKKSNLSRHALHCYIPPAVAPHTSLYSTHRMFMEKQANILDAPEVSLTLYGLPPYHRDIPEVTSAFREKLPGIPFTGLIGDSPAYELPPSCMHVPEAQRLIIDSAKLARLDQLLHELKAGDHRVLIYFQMTRMMDLMEEYLIYRQYKYVRLDGGTKIEDRRDLVMDWQTRPDIFIFLLSTRAGGLGINLTAADTVVFYDHDWNPSNDAQAMDRAHRLGQTRQVTVYRLITKGTIDERIVQLARVKKDVQDIVVGNKRFQDVTKPNEIVSLLLNDDELANLENQSVDTLNSSDSLGAGAAKAVREIGADEDDDFFGNGGSFAPQEGVAVDNGEDDENGNGSYAAPTGRGRGRSGRGSRGGRGGKPGPKRGYKRKAAMQED